jgi:transketolase
VSTLFFNEMRFDPNHMEYIDNDEFILSKGHAAPILYAALVEIGLISEKELLALRGFTSKLEGHPAPRLKGIKVATGSLGQGLSIGLGMAYAKKICNSARARIYVLVGDGEMAEGSVWEAINLAGKLKTSNLIAILDMNRLGQSGPTMFGWNSDEYAKRIKGFGWHTVQCDGHDVKELLEALEKAKASTTPTFVIAQTVKGKGVSFLENFEGKHGTVLDEGELRRAQAEILPRTITRGFQPENFIHASTQKLNQKTEFSIETSYEKGEMDATREAYGRALVKLGEQNRDMIVLDADVKNSTYTESFFDRFPSRSLQCYISEQNMVSIAVGLQTHGFKVFLATFACFLTRAFDQLRMAAYSGADLKIAGSHAGISVGEDGPSQMGLEDIALVRSLRGSIILYPCDAVSCEKLTCLSANYNGISYVRTTRPLTPVIYENDTVFSIGGCNVLCQNENDVLSILTAGVTVHEALRAHKKLKEEGIYTRIIDCYSVKPLDRTMLLKAYEETGRLLTVEDHYTQGGLGEAVASLGFQPRILAVRLKPHSGSPEKLLAEQGIDADGIVNSVKEIIAI